MKKRILIVLAILVLFSLTVLTACDTHEHEYSWKYDENGHWQECDCSDKTDKVAHIDDNADEKCDVCGYNMHKHSYSWKSDAVNHWEECSCGDKKEATPHVDVKNNETQAEGADGKCDVCALEIYVVTFNMQGHGEAIEAQNIGKGGKVTAPATPADDDAWKFGGWYKDAECENAFDFATEIINEATTVYAKWTEDTRDGASKAHAYALTLGEDCLQSIAKDQVVYFVYAAAENGRYTISLGLGPISQKCTFITDKTEGTYNAENGQINIDLAKSDKVYVMLTCAEELASDAMASVMIDECAGGDALPADLFPAGEYADGTGFSFELDRDEIYVSYNDIAYKAQYIGGEYNNKLIVTRNLGERDEVWTITPNSDGTYTLKIEGATNSTRTLKYVQSQAPVALSQLVGYYEPQKYTAGSEENNPGIEREDEETPTTGSGITNGILELYIYASASETDTYVRYKQVDNGNVWYGDLLSAEYDLEHNRLTTQDGIVITLNLAEDNSIESINVGSNLYIRKGDIGAVPPASLPLEANEEYHGETHTIRTSNGSQLFGAEGYNGITVMEFDEATGVYTIVVNNTASFATYKLTISEEDGIKLYQEDGTTLLDTLTKFEGQIQVKDLVVGAATTLTKDDFYKSLVYIKVTTTGWYEFTGISETLLLYANVPESSLAYYEFFGTITAGAAINLEEETLIVVACDDIGEGVSFTAQAIEAPKGSSEDNPYEYEDGLTINNVNNTDRYYVKFTAPADGTYSICAYYNFYDGSQTVRSYVCYAIDYVEYGYSWWMWVGGTSEEEPWAVVDATEGQEIMIAINRDGESDEWVDVVYVEIAEYVPVVKEAIFTEEQAGTYIGETSFEFWGETYNYDITLKFDIYGSGTYSLDQGYGADDYRISIKVGEDGTYSFVYNDFTVSFSIDESALNVEDDDLGEFTLEKGEDEEPDVPEGITYTGQLESGNDIMLVITGTRVLYYVDMGSGFDIDTADDYILVGNVYSITNFFGDTHTFTISEDGQTINFNDGALGAGTLTKQDA